MMPSPGITSYGMQSFDQSLMFLMKEALVTYDEALKHCTNPDDFALRVKEFSPRATPVGRILSC